jgi:hypothetical protein
MLEFMQSLLQQTSPIQERSSLQKRTSTGCVCIPVLIHQSFKWRGTLSIAENSDDESWLPRLPVLEAFLAQEYINNV